MLTEELGNAVALLARSLKSTDAVKRYSKARHGYETAEEVTRLNEAFCQAAQSYREMQAAGTLTEQAIHRVRTLQSNLNQHPLAIEYMGAQQEMVELLRECTRQMTEVLGIDFAGTGVPAGCC